MARLEELERKFEENPRRYFAPLANEYRKAGDAQRAADLCRSQLPEVPGHISGHIVLGQALYDARDFEGSRAALETALALDPENIVALRYLGDIARDTGDAAEAERWYSRTLEADPYNEAATTALRVLRAAPATAPAIASPPSEPEPQPASDSLAAGFEPTSHVEPESAEPAEPPPAVEVAPFAEITDVGQPESALDAAEAAQPEQGETEIPVEQVESSAGTSFGEPEVAAAPELAQSEIAEPPELTGEASAAPTERAEQSATATTEPGELAIVAQPEPAVEEAPSDVTEATELALAPVSETDTPQSGVLAVTGEFAGDLSVSAAPEAVESVTDEAPAEPEITEPMIDEPPAAAETVEPPIDEPTSAPETTEPASEPPVAAEPGGERYDVAAHAPPEQAPPEEVMQTEERVLESAAPFVTETMADLYLEQGYPHEALELLLQLSEQRPDDEQLRGKIEHIESVIMARRDAAVAAARAERAETAEAAAEAERLEDAVEAASEPPEPELEPEPEPESPISVRELFARMDRARPRAPGSVTARPISRRRSDFVPMPEGEATASEASDDPFAFPNPPAPAPPPVLRTSGPQPTFNPSTADTEDFNAWLRGLKGP